VPRIPGTLISMRNPSKKPKQIVAILCCGAIVAASALALLWPAGPRYQGKSLTYWLDQIESWDGREDFPAAQAFQAMGASAVPALRKYITPRPDPLDGDQRRTQACKAICAIGPPAQAALGALTNALFGGSVEGEITEALGC
jgi:hypothetical protein